MGRRANERWHEWVEMGGRGRRLLSLTRIEGDTRGGRGGGGVGGRVPPRRTVSVACLCGGSPWTRTRLPGSAHPHILVYTYLYTYVCIQFWLLHTIIYIIPLGAGEVISRQNILRRRKEKVKASGTTS